MLRFQKIIIITKIIEEQKPACNNRPIHLATDLLNCVLVGSNITDHNTHKFYVLFIYFIS